MTERNLTRRVTVYVDGEEWQQAESLSEAGADEAVFVVDHASGARVLLGDGTHGRRPPDGAIATISYRDGDGTEGNTGVSVTTRWPPAECVYQVALSSTGVCIDAIGAGVERLSGAKRVSYFAGQVLAASDFQAEQQYLIGRRWLHNRLLHGFGIADGLSVTIANDASSTSVVVGPGLALDRLGREVQLVDRIALPIVDRCGPCFVIVEYVERETDLAPAGLDADAMVASRIEEGALIRLSDQGVTDHGVALARLVPDSTGWKVDAAFEPARCNRCTT